MIYFSLSNLTNTSLPIKKLTNNTHAVKDYVVKRRVFKERPKTSRPKNKIPMFSNIQIQNSQRAKVRRVER